MASMRPAQTTCAAIAPPGSSSSSSLVSPGRACRNAASHAVNGIVRLPGSVMIAFVEERSRVDGRRDHSVAKGIVRIIGNGASIAIVAQRPPSLVVRRCRIG